MVISAKCPAGLIDKGTFCVLPEGPIVTNPIRDVACFGAPCPCGSGCDEGCCALTSQGVVLPRKSRHYRKQCPQNYTLASATTCLKLPEQYTDRFSSNIPGDVGAVEETKIVQTAVAEATQNAVIDILKGASEKVGESLEATAQALKNATEPLRDATSKVLARGLNQVKTSKGVCVLFIVCLALVIFFAFVIHVTTSPSSSSPPSITTSSDVSSNIGVKGVHTSLGASVSIVADPSDGLVTGHLL